MSLLIKHLILNKTNYVKLCIGTRLLVDFFPLEVHSEGTTYLIYAHALKNLFRPDQFIDYSYHFEWIWKHHHKVAKKKQLIPLFEVGYIFSIWGVPSCQMHC